MIVMNDFARHVASMREELHAAIDRVVASGCFILGNEVAMFERDFASFLGVKHVVGVGNGMDAIELALAATGVGEHDEVVTTPNSAFASTLAILKRRAVPKFVDIDERTYGLDVAQVATAIGPRTRAILPVHIYGQALDLTTLQAIADEKKVALINDAAQAHGARWRDIDVAQFGRAAAYSFYPTKNLGCFGDGGAVATNDDMIAAHVRRARDYGQERRYVHVDADAMNTRLDEVQAAILRVKLRHLRGHNARRAAIARHYEDCFRNIPVRVPTIATGSSSVNHLFVVRTPRRDELMHYLREKGIASLIHYPVIIPLQPAMTKFGYRVGQLPIAERVAAEIMSLPIHPELTDSDVETVSRAVCDFFE